MKNFLKSPEEENFCYLIAKKGMTRDNAYREAFADHTSTYEEVRKRTQTLFRHEDIINRVNELRYDFYMGQAMSVDEIVTQMSQRMRLDLRQMFDRDGSFKDIHDLTQEQAMCIAEFQVEEIWSGRGDERVQIGTLKKVKLVDIKALWDMMLKKYGAYVSRLVVDNTDLSHIEEIVNEFKK